MTSLPSCGKSASGSYMKSESMRYLCGGVPVDLRTRLGRIKLLPRRFANRLIY